MSYRETQPLTITPDDRPPTSHPYLDHIFDALERVYCYPFTQLASHCRSASPCAFFPSEFLETTSTVSHNMPSKPLKLSQGSSQPQSKTKIKPKTVRLDIPAPINSAKKLNSKPLNAVCAHFLFSIKRY